MLLRLKSWSLWRPSKPAGLCLALAAACAACAKQAASPAPSEPPSPDGTEAPAPATDTAAGPPARQKPRIAPAKPAARAAPVVGQDRTVAVLKQQFFYYKSADDNHQTARQGVDFPAAGQLFSQITLKLSLSCPDPACDAWDRLGAVSLVLEDGRRLELARFITPYGVGAQWTVDVTEFAPVLSGHRDVEVLVETWVGPGHPQGAGWLLDCTFEFKGGRPDPWPVAVVPVFDLQAVAYGDPATPPGRQQSVTVPTGTFGKARLRTFITGHGQGNSDNCAEFCSKTHTLQVNGQKFPQDVWRDDCGQTRTDSPQRGTWTLARAGWCPGATVQAWEQDVALGGQTLDIGYEPEAYVNARNGGYDQGGHTPPHFRLSTALILFAPATGSSNAAAR